MFNHEYGSDLCVFCPLTDYGDSPVNTSPYDLCEGCRCEQASEIFLEETGEEFNENTSREVIKQYWKNQELVQPKKTSKRKIFILWGNE